MKIEIPRFMLVPDEQNNQLFILCTKSMSLILVTQTTPAQLLLVRGPQEEQTLLDAAEFWKAQGARF
ncbi:MAG: hypothetical protein C0424_10255 [Sphingobacteriaceae bacterium]|nr:hypothetical protein [Sphingobacteriaceae bacterium]